MAEKELTVDDIGLVGFTSKNRDDAIGAINRLLKLSSEYTALEGINDIEEFERIKKAFIGELQFLTPLYSKVRKYKDSNHQYLGEHRKRLKSETLKRLRDSKVKVTEARDVVYDEGFYKDRLRLIESFSELFTVIEERQKEFERTLDAIKQSINIASKERSYSKGIGE